MIYYLYVCECEYAYTCVSMDLAYMVVCSKLYSICGVYTVPSMFQLPILFQHPPPRFRAP